MQLSNPESIQLFKFTSQFLTHWRRKITKLYIYITQQIIISTLCLTISTAQNSFNSQVKSSPVSHNSDFKHSIPFIPPPTSIPPLPLLSPRQKTSSPASQRNYNTSYRNPSILQLNSNCKLHLTKLFASIIFISSAEETEKSIPCSLFRFHSLFPTSTNYSLSLCVWGGVCGVCFDNINLLSYSSGC